MPLRIHDTATRSVREFIPITEGTVRLYQCGATVQASPHVGHIRSGLVFDVLVRWLEISGFDVVLCRNVTDIDDKILAKAQAQDVPWWSVATKYEREFTAAYDILGCRPPDVEPRATGHITQIVELIERLIDSGHAYDVDGDVYFDVASYGDYGSLSGQRLADLRPAADSAADTRKRHPADFALWKSTSDPTQPSWPTPWGPGRPGWHVECSAMSTTYLGPHFDIHGGGLDLLFPHHENEQAQSRAAGDGFANYWMHNAWVTTSGEKMSKSLGNSLLVEEVLKRIRPLHLRWYLVSAHYRSNLEFSDAALAESAAGFHRIAGFIERATERVGEVPPTTAALPAEFVTAMNDDLSTPAAVAIIHEYVTRGNTYLTDRDSAEVADVLQAVRSMLWSLGVDPMDPHWHTGTNGAEAAHTALAALITAELEARAAARADRDYQLADAIRDRIADAGIMIEDTPAGVRWSLPSGE